MINAFVHVVESPSPEDLLLDRTEGRVLVGALDLAKIPRWYSLATNRATFVYALQQRLAEAFAAHQKPPMLHLSMHGDSNGLRLTSGEFLSWDDLRALLAPLNNAMQGGLLICMSTCFGVSGCRMAMFEGADQPFWALVGNAGSPTWPDAAVAYVAFYHLFFKGAPLQTCIDAMRAASGDLQFTWHSGKQTKDLWATFTQAHLAALTAGIQNVASVAPPSSSNAGPEP